MPLCHAMMTEGRQNWVQNVRNISNNGLGYFGFVSLRLNGITAADLKAGQYITIPTEL